MEVQKLAHAEPFVPFTLVITSGDKYEVKDPGLFFVGDNIVYIVQRATGLAIFRRNRIAGLEAR